MGIRPVINCNQCLATLRIWLHLLWAGDLREMPLIRGKAFHRFRVLVGDTEEFLVIVVNDRAIADLNHKRDMGRVRAFLDLYALNYLA